MGIIDHNNIPLLLFNYEEPNDRTAWDAIPIGGWFLWDNALCYKIEDMYFERYEKIGSKTLLYDVEDWFEVAWNRFLGRLETPYMG